MTSFGIALFIAVAVSFAIAIFSLYRSIIRDGLAFGGIAPRTWQRFAISMLAILSFGVGAKVYALPWLIATTPVAGNGRGDTLVNRPACINAYRGRTFMIYATDGTKTDTPFQVCRYTSSGGLAWTSITLPNE